MTGSRTNPTAARLALAKRLKEARLRSGKSSDDAAQAIVGDRSKVSRLERGERIATRRDLRDLGHLYGLSDDEVDELDLLATEARKKGWWADYRTQDEQAATYLGLEATATSMQMVENLRMPGLLQTREMSLALLSGLRPPGELSEAFIKDQVEIRQKRQERLIGGELAFHAVLDQAMFELRVDRTTMTVQVQRLIELAKLPNLTIQIVPYATGIYPALDGTFNIMNFGEIGLDSVVFVEGLLGNHVVEKAQDVAHYLDVFSSVTQLNALGPDESIAWLKQRIPH